MIKLRWKKTVGVNEDDAPQTQDVAAEDAAKQANDAKLIELQKQKAAITGQIRKDEDAFNQKKAGYTAQLNALDTQIASLGGNITAESLEYKFSKNLYESVGSIGYKEALVSLLKMTFDDAYPLSLTPDETSYETWSKNLLGWLNTKISTEYWKTDGVNHLQDFINMFRKISIDNQQYNKRFLMSEKNRILKALEKNIRSSDMFKWLLGPDEIR